MPEVAELCDRVAIMSRGRIVFEGTMADLETQAEEPVYTLRTTDQDRARQAAEETGGVTLVSAEDRGAIAFTSGEAGLKELTAHLARAGVGIVHLAARETPLE